MSEREDWLTDPRAPVPVGIAAEAYTGLLKLAERAGWQRDGLIDTPTRAAAAWKDLTCGYGHDPAELLKTFDGEGYDEMVLLTGYPVYSLCEHHLLPFMGSAHVGYIPDDKIAGLSKLGRVVDCFARRLQNQERITTQVADALEEHLQPAGVVVVIEARHMCMEMRGVARAGQVMKTSAVRGALKDKPEARAEALALIEGGNVV